jgi:hypothetical protein
MSTITISLLEWLRSGSVGPIAPGMPWSRLEAALGLSDDVGVTSRKYRRPSIWKYGDVEFYLNRDTETIASILLHDFVIPDGGERLRLDPWMLSRGAQLDVVTHALADEDIACRREEPTGHSSFLRLVTHSGVALVFERMIEDASPWILYGVNQTV